MKIEIALCLPRDAETVAVVRDVAVGALGRLGVKESCVDDIRLALSEACTNVLDHSGADDEYEVRLEVEDDRCEISVVDATYSFDSSSLDLDMPDPMSPRGRGLAIMRSMVDQIRFTSEPAAGTIVHLVKTLDLDPAGSMQRLLDRGAGPH